MPDEVINRTEPKKGGIHDSKKMRYGAWLYLMLVVGRQNEWDQSLGTFDWPYSDRERIYGGTNIKILIKSYCNFLDY